MPPAASRQPPAASRQPPAASRGVSRAWVEHAIETLIDWLDALDGDSDDEPDDGE